MEPSRRTIRTSRPSGPTWSAHPPTSSNDDAVSRPASIGRRPSAPDDRPMTPSIAPTRRPLSSVDLASLLFLGAVWGAAFLFLRIAAPQVGPAWAAEIRLAIGAAVLVVVAG